MVSDLHARAEGQGPVGCRQTVRIEPAARRRALALPVVGGNARLEAAARQAREGRLTAGSPALRPRRSIGACIPAPDLGPVLVVHRPRMALTGGAGVAGAAALALDVLAR